MKKLWFVQRSVPKLLTTAKNKTPPERGLEVDNAPDGENMTDTYYRARMQIMNELLSFCMIRSKDWKEDRKPIPGDLVSLDSAPATKWYVSWVVETELNKGDWHRYLLQSIEDYELCWWENVGIEVYNPQRVREMPSWRWTDRQFKFVDKWNRVAYKDNDAYIVLPGKIDFDGNSVILDIRERYGAGHDNPFHYSETFKWKKATKAELDAFYKRGCQEREKWIELRKQKASA